MNVVFRVPKVKIVVGRMDFVLERCNGKKVLHLGCVDEGLTEERIRKGELLHTRLMDVAKETWGVDSSAEGIELLKECGINNLVVGDIEHLEQMEELKQQNFDVILLTEVLEHLNNPGLFLQGVKNLFSQNTIMIITVPNGLRLTGLGYTLKGYEFVHPDHNYWFSYKTLDTLMEKNGYIVMDTLVYTFFDYSISLKKIKKIPKVIIRKYLSHRNPFFVSDGIIVVVKPELDK